MRRLLKKEERVLLHACSLHEVFPLLHDPLRQIQQDYDELSPVEVWLAAIDFSDQLLAMHEPELEIPYLVEDLEEESDTENGAFLVMLASVYRLAPLRKKDERVVPAIRSLLPYYCNHRLYRDLMLAIGDVEDARRWRGKTIDLLEYQLRSLPALDDVDTQAHEHKIMSEFAEVVKLCNCKVLANVVSVFSEFNDKHNGRFADILEDLRTKQHQLDQPVGQGLTYVQHQTVSGDQNTFRDEASLAKVGLPAEGLTMEMLTKLLNNAQLNQLTDGR